MKATRHIPGFVEADASERYSVEFQTEEELLSVPWIASWADENLFRFSVARSKESTSLMAELKDGHFYVVAHLDGDIPSLPTWSYDECKARAKEVK